MLEATLTGGAGAGKSYPDSGPGPKVLKFGSTELGYFGEASSSEMFTLAELRQQTSFYDGTDTVSSPSWIKMFLGGKIIYFPTQVLANPVSWAQLYAKGLVYGVDGPGTFPGTPAVNQLVYVFKDKFSFKVRCFGVHEDDPATHGGLETIATSPILKASEWGKVISALISPRQSGYTGDNWALYNLNSFLLPENSAYFVGPAIAVWNKEQWVVSSSLQGPPGVGVGEGDDLELVNAYQTAKG